MMMMFLLMAVGFILRKKDVLPDNASTMMAKLLTYAFVPALTLKAQINNCTPETFKENAELIVYGLILTLVAITVAYPLSRLFIRNHKECAESTYQRNIYKYALAFANFGYVGDFVVLGVFGDEMYFKYTLFKFFMVILCYGWGLYILVPKDKGANFFQNLKNGLVTPPMIAVVIGIILGLLNFRAYMPDFVMTALSNAGACQGPLAMVLAGFVVGGYSFKDMILNKKVYLASLMRLIVLPAAMLGILIHLRPVLTNITAAEVYDTVVLPFTLIAFAAPLGLNTIIYPATYGGDTKTGAAMTLISSIMATVTLPLMYLLFVVIL